MSKFIAIVVDHENNADLWWSNLWDRFPKFASRFSQDGKAIVTESVLDTLMDIEGLSEDPEYAPLPFIEYPSNSDGWCDAAASRHGVFETLE